MFTQSCFIRKNTQDIREELESLGYKYSGRESKQDKLPCLYCFHGQYYECNNIPGRYDKIIDCGTNEDLFFAIAALRDDTDIYQYFITDKDFRSESNPDFFFIPKGASILCVEDKWSVEELPAHKATVEELIEHFKEQRYE